jgi:hypothetical protein
MGLLFRSFFMPRKNNNSLTGPAAVSVTAMAEQLKLNRSYFWTLAKQGVFPMPLYDLRTKRPFFDADLQADCLDIRRSNVGWHGNYVLFYDRPATPTPTARPRRSTRQPRNRVSLNTPALVELAESLRDGLGVEATDEQISDAASVVYPNGLADCDGEAIRRVRAQLRGKK